MIEPVGGRPRTVRRDEGFTLIEVVISLSLLAILATAALYFFVGGTRAISHQQRAHGAIALANDAMEEAFSWVPTAATPGSSGLVVGRTQTEVTASWAAATASAVSGVADTYPTWDTSTVAPPLAGSGDDAVPLTAVSTESRTQYTVTTLLGTCYRTATVTTGTCSTAGGTALGVAATGYVRLMRVIVVVRWPDASKTCSASSCSYEISALIDPNSDVEWNNTTRLLAVDDSVAVNAGQSVVVDVLANDTLMEILTNPVSLGVGPTIGTVALDVTTGKFTYTATPTATIHGEVLFSYWVTIGARTAQAWVHVYVNPQALSYATTTAVGTPVNIPMTTVSSGKPSALTIVTPPSAGTASADTSAAQASFTYTPGAAGTYWFDYTYLDAEGMTSLAGRVLVTVTNFAAPVVADLAMAMTTFQADAPVVLPAQPGSGYLVRVITPPTMGIARVDGQNSAPDRDLTGVVLTYSAPNVPGTYTFTYQMVTPDGLVASATKVVTVTVSAPAVIPTANDLAATIRKTKEKTFNLFGAPTGVTLEKVSDPSCASVLNWDQGTGAIKLKGGPDVGNCTFTPQAVIAGPPQLSSDIVTITVTVVP